MKLNLITLATVKEELGLTDTTYDAKIMAMIPKVSTSVRQILNTNYDTYMSADFNDSGDTIALSVMNHADLGQVLEHENIPDDTYIVSYDPDTDLYTLSETPTGDGNYIYPTINIAMWSAISKMIWYRIQKTNTVSALEKGVTSKSIGSVSVSYTNAEINSKWNYPQILIDDLGTPFSKVG